MTAQAIARRLKKWRRTDRIGQKEAARRLGISLHTFRSYEQEVRKPSKLAQRAILQFLGDK